MSEETTMASVERVLVVGAGSAGCVVAGFLARAGVAVDVVEIHDDITALGSGITVQGNALRVLKELGVWEEVEQIGFGFAATGIRSWDGTLVATLADIRTGGEDLPATMGMERPRLAGVVFDAAQRYGARFRMGTTVTSLAPDTDGVDVTFTDGTSGRYDLVIGADGLRSDVRAMIGITDVPEPVGMGIWRVFCDRPESITRTDLCFDGPCFSAGFCPTGPNSMYAYLIEPQDDGAGKSPEEGLAHMRALAEHYHGPWDDIRERIVDPSTIHYTWFEWMVLERPWYEGRVVLIGDAAHNCPPTLAQGAAQAMEDAMVLADELTRGQDVQAALDAFMARRLPRAKAVVEASVQVSRWLMERNLGPHLNDTMTRTLTMLCDPA
jgi:2-polyprenyl-6-methoxyphenol hydroxylase-like FAD-dependent oxidoreductase